MHRAITAPPGSSLGMRLLAILFALFAVPDFWQVAEAMTARRSDQPSALVAEHALAGIAGVAAAAALWRGLPWAAGAIVVWGLLTAVLLATLPALLDLPAEARPGIWLGVAVVLALSLLAAWWARRRGAPRRAP